MDDGALFVPLESHTNTAHIRCESCDHDISASEDHVGGRELCFKSLGI